MTTLSLRDATQQLIHAGYTVTVGYSTLHVSSRNTDETVAKLAITRIDGKNPHVNASQVEELCRTLDAATIYDATREDAPRSKQPVVDLVAREVGACKHCGSAAGIKCQSTCTRRRNNPW